MTRRFGKDVAELVSAAPLDGTECGWFEGHCTRWSEESARAGQGHVESHGKREGHDNKQGHDKKTTLGHDEIRHHLGKETKGHDEKTRQVIRK